MINSERMKIVLLTNDNYFSFKVLERFLVERRQDIKLVVFSSALVGKKGLWASIIWSLKNTGFRHTFFKLMVYGVFRAMKVLCKFFSFIDNRYSSWLWIQRNRITAIKTADVNSNEVVDQIRSIAPDLIVSVSMNQIVKKEILRMPSKHCINVHCAPLPRYGGMSPYIWALANNEDHSAATIHYMEEGLDEGDIIVQQKVDVMKNDSAFSLFFRCCLKASDLLCNVINDIESGKVQSYKQDLSKKTYFSWPDKECIRRLKDNGFYLAKIADFTKAILINKPRIK